VSGHVATRASKSSIGDDVDDGHQRRESARTHVTWPMSGWTDSRILVFSGAAEAGDVSRGTRRGLRPDGSPRVHYPRPSTSNGLKHLLARNWTSRPAGQSPRPGPR